MSTTQTTQTTQPDLVAVKQRQQKMWASGDYSAVAARIAVMAEDMVQAAGLKAGERVLDVATGSGNAAIAAARNGCEVTATDYVPELLERGRARAAAEGLEVWFAEADAEDLRTGRGVRRRAVRLGSCCADQERRRRAVVCAGPRKIAMVNWTPTGFIGAPAHRRQARAAASRGQAADPVGDRGATRRAARRRRADLKVTRREFVVRFRSPEDFTRFFRDNYGPTLKAFEALDEPGRERLFNDLTALATEHDQEPGPSVAIPSEYLEVVATRR